MNPDQVGGLVRNILIPLAAFAAAHGIAAGTWDGIVGLLVACATFGWAAWGHDATSDMLLSLVRSAIGAVGGFAVQRGWASADSVTLYSGVLLTLVPNIWTWIVHADPNVAAPPKP